MVQQSFPLDLKGVRVHLIGAKGTGMAALAEILHSRDAILSGSDVPDTFYTDAVLRRIGLEPHAGFSTGHLVPLPDLVIYSDAYTADGNVEMAEAARLGIPMFSYARALGALSGASDSSGIAGVHGKTTSTAMAGSMIAALGLPATVIAGSAVRSFGDRCTHIAGSRFFVAETDEYKHHFMHFSPRRIMLTSVESDHQDYYPTYGSIFQAFCDYVEKLPPGGLLVYCEDDAGARDVALQARKRRPDLRFEPYGFSAEGPFRIRECNEGEGVTRFRIGAREEPFELHVPGRHLVLDAAGALAIVLDMVKETRKPSGKGEGPNQEEWNAISASLAAFSGSRRRSESIGEAGGILVMDDYAHHPTALRATIEGFKAFWPHRRLVVDFMSHTYSRTIALMDEFATSLDPADCVILHGIYASAREKPMEGVSGRDLFGKVAARRPELVRIRNNSDASGESADRGQVAPEQFILYTESHADAMPELLGLLRPGDLFVTMGAGDNWKLGRKILAALQERQGKEAHDA
jgi:UDP-N-acetylmuramate--alanine ligase